jgi:hypothetical protein
MQMAPTMPSRETLFQRCMEALPGILLFVLLIVLYLMTVSCGGSTSVTTNPTGRGTASVSISDPPHCKVPNGNYKHVYISIRSVQAHISSQAADNAGGWVELAPQLATVPVQIDLLATPQGGCTLAMLGSNVSLPVGDYQQIRLILVSNSPASGEPVPANNACGSNGFNCVVLQDDSVHRLNLSSQANTGLKIPPGQIVGGPIRVSEGLHTDINIDFNACASILRQGNNQYRLKPTLTAGQVSRSNSGLSGQVVDAATQQPISGGTVMVAIEQADNTGFEQIIMQAAADANGNFSFCPLPAGNYDVVAVAVDGAGVVYGPTIAFSVPHGTTLGKLPLIATSGTATGAATIQGVVTATTGTAGSTVDVALAALQSVTPSGGTPKQVIIPLLPTSTALVATSATPSGITCPANTNCAEYSLLVPGMNPSFGTFSSGTITFSTPATGDVNYTVEGRAFVPATSTATCSPSRVTQDKDSTDQPLKVTPGATTNAKQLDFTGCS